MSQTCLRNKHLHRAPEEQPVEEEEDIIGFSHPADGSEQHEKFVRLLEQASDAALPDTVLGQKISLDSCLYTTKGPPYVRTCVMCPLRDGCFKNRNVDLDGSQLGTIALLGSWLSSADDFADRFQHMAKKPKPNRGCKKIYVVV